MLVDLFDAAQTARRCPADTTACADENAVPVGPMLEPWVTTSDAAALVGLTPARIRQLAAAGVVPARRVGSIWLVDPVALAARYRRPAGEAQA